MQKEIIVNKLSEIDKIILEDHKRVQINMDAIRTKMLRPNTVWKHFKGSTAVILTLAKHSETNESLVVYRCINGNGLSSKDDIYARHLEMFLSEVDKEKYPECKQKYRFELIGSYGGTLLNSK